MKTQRLLIVGGSLLVWLLLYCNTPLSNATTASAEAPIRYTTFLPSTSKHHNVPLPISTVRNPKKGIAATFAYRYDFGHIPFNAGWYYTWSLFPGRWQTSDMEFIPMWPCLGSTNYVTNTLGHDYDGYLLFLNEPDVPNQCTMSIHDAALYYVQVREALPHAKLIGPQTLMQKNGSYAGWTAAWREEVLGLTGRYPNITGYGFHIYPIYQNGDSPTDVLTDICQAMAAWGELGHKELWITEFGIDNFMGPPADVRQAVTDTVELFENGLGPCKVDRYAYFTDFRQEVTHPHNPIMHPDGVDYFDLYWRNSFELSHVGEAYRLAGN